MKITGIKTTVLSIPHLEGIQDATIRHRSKGLKVWAQEAGRRPPAR